MHVPQGHRGRSVCSKNTIPIALPGTLRSACYSGAHLPCDAPTRGDGRALKTFSNDVLQHLRVEADIEHHLLELAVLDFELLQAAELGNTYAAVLFLSVAKGRL